VELLDLLGSRKTVTHFFPALFTLPMYMGTGHGLITSLRDQ